jgi:integrase
MNGTIDHRPDRNKPWRARYFAPNGKQPSKSFKTKREAQEWLRHEIRKIDRGAWTDPNDGKRLYSHHAEDWISGKLRVKEKTKAGYRSLLRSRIIPEFGTTQLRHIRPATIRSWVASMADEGLSPSRIRQAHQVLSASLKQAVLDGLIDSNPASGIELPREKRRKMTALTVEQINALAAYAEDLQAGAGTLVTVLAYSGIRWGEAIALRVESVDPLHRQIHISASATEVEGRLVVGVPKTYRIRTVVLPKTVSDALAEHIYRRGIGPGETVFSSPLGGMLRSANFGRRVWQPATSRLYSDYPGLKPLRVHDLRHAAASIAISCGANIKVVQRMLGHEKASVTLDIYGHLYTDDLEHVAAAIDERLRGAA